MANKVSDSQTKMLVVISLLLLELLDVTASAKKRKRKFIILSKSYPISFVAMEIIITGIF